MRGHEFNLDVGYIDAILGFKGLNHEGVTHFTDRMVALEIMQHCIGGHKEGRHLKITLFPPDLRCLIYVMMRNLYLVKNLTNLNNARVIFLMELREGTHIDISAHLYSIIADTALKTISKSKLNLPNLIIRILNDQRVEIPGHIGLLVPTNPITSQTILRSRVRLPGEEHAEETKEIPHTNTKTKVEGQQLHPRPGGRGSLGS